MVSQFTLSEADALARAILTLYDVEATELNRFEFGDATWLSCCEEIARCWEQGGVLRLVSGLTSLLRRLPECKFGCFIFRALREAVESEDKPELVRVVDGIMKNANSEAAEVAQIPHCFDLDATPSLPDGGPASEVDFSGIHARLGEFTLLDDFVVGSSTFKKNMKLDCRDHYLFIVGPNGAGKSALLSAVFTALQLAADCHLSKPLTDVNDAPIFNVRLEFVCNSRLQQVFKKYFCRLRWQLPRDYLAGPSWNQIQTQISRWIDVQDWKVVIVIDTSKVDQAWLTGQLVSADDTSQIPIYEWQILKQLNVPSVLLKRGFRLLRKTPLGYDLPSIIHHVLLQGVKYVDQDRGAVWDDKNIVIRPRESDARSLAPMTPSAVLRQLNVAAQSNMLFNEYRRTLCVCEAIESVTPSLKLQIRTNAVTALADLYANRDLFPYKWELARQRIGELVARDDSYATGMHLLRSHPFGYDSYKESEHAPLRALAEALAKEDTAHQLGLGEPGNPKRIGAFHDDKRVPFPRLPGYFKSLLFSSTALEFGSTVLLDEPEIHLRSEVGARFVEGMIGKRNTLRSNPADNEHWLPTVLVVTHSSSMYRTAQIAGLTCVLVRDFEVVNLKDLYGNMRMLCAACRLNARSRSRAAARTPCCRRPSRAAPAVIYALSAASVYCMCRKGTYYVTTSLV